MNKSLQRRDFLKLAGTGLAAAAGVRALPKLGSLLSPIEVVKAAGSGFDLYFAGTDGWISLPGSPAIPPYHPDNLAPSPFTTYIFGFRNVTGLSDKKIAAQKMKAQHTAPLFWARQGVLFKLQLTNLGLAMRPDLTDAHTVHWHGFRNVIPFFDGEPSSSISVPIGRTFIYAFNSHEPGTYMYHCHVEDVEHVQMGMTGMVFVRPQQDGTSKTFNGRTYIKFAYNDGSGSTGFDREYPMMLTEVWTESHWADAHIQLPEWSDYKADFSLLNGRVYPDTLSPSGSVDPFNPVRDASGDLIAPAGSPHLKYQPYSSLVRCNVGESVLLRFANLGFIQSAMTLGGIRMRVVGRDATFLRGRDATDNSYLTETVSLGAGESADALFTAPAYRGPGPYDTYLLYNRNYAMSSNLSGGYGGQMTEVRVYPAGTLGPQTVPGT